MNVKEIADLARSTVLFDDKKPYRWSNIELVSSLNGTLDEFCRETLVLIDQTTPSVTQIKLLSNLGFYDLDSRIVVVKSARLLGGTGRPLTKTSEERLDLYIPNWRNVTGTPRTWAPREQSSLSIYPKYDAVGEVIGSSDISFASATKKITKAGATFTTHFSIGDSINVSGTNNNNGSFTISALSDTEITVNETLVDEANKSAVLRKVKETLMMVVHRIPLTPFTDHDLEVSSPPSPEIKSIYHEGLLHGIGKRLFLKPDAETLDKRKAEEHRLLFEEVKAKAKIDFLRFTAIADTAGPHPGAI